MGTGKKRWGIPRLFFLLLLIVFFFYGVVFSGKTLSTSQLVPGTTPAGPYTTESKAPRTHPFSFDLTGNAWINEPNPYIVRENISKTAVPAWNSNEGLGMPIIANPNTEVFNPLKIFLNLKPNPFLQDMFFLLRLLTMGVFTCLFLRELGLSNLSSLFGAVFFMLSGYSVWWINLHPMSSMAYIPGMFYFYERTISKKDNGNVVLSSLLFSLFLAFSIFGGKLPVVIMGLMLLFIYAIYRKTVHGSRFTVHGKETTPKDGIASSRSLKTRNDKKGYFHTKTFRKAVFGFFPLYLIILTISGLIIASALILPFAELLARSSLLAKSVRTGASSHTLPLIPSITMWQPLFLGFKNYFYGSWLEWSPKYMMPYAGLTVLLLYIYSILNKRVLANVLPFSLFSIFLFLKIYGLIPNDIFIGIPVLGSMNFIKYHGMLYFSLAVISAYSIEDIKTNSCRTFYFAVILTSIILLAYFYALYNLCPPEKINYITKILIACLSVLFITGLLFYLSGVKGRGSGALNKKILVTILFLLMLAELYVYKPEQYHDRIHPYTPPPYLELIRENNLHRIVGDGSSVPPLVSSAIGLYDLRGINVLIPDNYYQFFENLVSFSIPYTNNPSLLVAATSPQSDLLGVKYILGTDKLDIEQLRHSLKSHLEGLRIIRFFDSMKSHRIKGGRGYGYFSRAEDERFSLFFLQRFKFASRIKITEPYLFIGLALKDAEPLETHIDTQPAEIGNPPLSPSNTGRAERIRVSINGKSHTFPAYSEKWTDRWIDISEFAGKTADITIEGASPGQGLVVLGSFGLSKGREWEERLLNTLYERHFKEFDLIKYIGQYQGIHIYENENVMPRAFMLHETKTINSMKQIISELQNGLDFRKTALVSGKDLSSVMFNGDKGEDTVTVKEYSSNMVEIDVNTKGGLLVLSDLYYPGWRVKVNGEKKDIIRTFGSLRGVVMPEGKNRVVFYYRPLSLYMGIVISFTFLIGWIVFLFIKGRR